jgi:hypothetical protein
MPLFLPLTISRPGGLFTGDYRIYRGGGQPVDSHTERGDPAERCNGCAEVMGRFGGRGATLRREGCNGIGPAVSHLGIEFKGL